MHQVFPAVFRDGRRLLTPNLITGKSLSEPLLTIRGVEYRVWEPEHSKLAAAIAKGLKELPIKPGSSVLYLGIANGNTASFVSDIIGREGLIYGVEVSERAFRELGPLAEKRGNIVPILADARKPQGYGWVEPVDCIFQDVATNDQSEILIRNAKQFLKPNGFALLSLKARSIDAVQRPAAVYKAEEQKLAAAFTFVQKLLLDPFEKDHAFYLLRFR